MLIPNQVKEYKIKSKFYGWKESNEQQVLEYAKWKIRAITTGNSNEDRLKIVNSFIKGSQFTLRDLLCQE